MSADKVDANDYSVVWNDATQQYDKVKKPGLPERVDDSNWWLGTQVKPKCECGIASLGYEVGHSDWCPCSTGGR